MIPPSGAITLLFTDIEGSTRMWEAHPEVMRASLARHDKILRDAIEQCSGHVFKTVGDSFCAVFSSAPNAVKAAIEAQQALASAQWPDETPIKVRMALHTGVVESRDDDYFGPPVNRVARLLSAAHGRQTILSGATCVLVRDVLPGTVTLRDLGVHQLKDLAIQEQVYQLLHPHLPGDFPPIKSLSTHPTNLPHQLTSFVGREKEMAEIGEMLLTSRLVTLTGSGGTGKTRLAVQAAAEVLERYSDGSWLVELAALTDPGLVLHTVAVVLGLKEDSGVPILQTLTEYLKDRRLLLVLDNCEHLLHACAELADATLRYCPRVVILATSREALGIVGEQTYRLPSLSLPDPRQPQTAETLARCESVQLFLDRIRLIKPGFSITSGNSHALASICHRLDGIPLAIELAAARVRSLTVEEISARLDQRFRLLTSGSRTALPRQQTLRSLIDWSYDLLNEDEKRLLNRVSVFAGGWTLEAAEGVCSDFPDEVLDLLTSLCDKSLVLPEERGGATRYRLLETVRQYALDRLAETGANSAVVERHRDWFLTFAEETQPKLKGPDQAHWYQRLVDEQENMRAAIDYCCDREARDDAAKASAIDLNPALGPDGEAGIRLATALYNFWMTRGSVSEGRQRYADLLNRAAPQATSLILARATHKAGNLAFAQSDFTQARSYLERAATMFHELGDRGNEAGALLNIGSIAHQKGEYSDARKQFEQSLAVFEELGNQEGIAVSVSCLGNVLRGLGDWDAARALLRRAANMNRIKGDRLLEANTLNNLAVLEEMAGDDADARDTYGKALEISKEVGSKYQASLNMLGLAKIALRKGEIDTSGSYLVEAITGLREAGARTEIAHWLSIFATLEVAAERGQGVRSATLWAAAEVLRKEIGAQLSQNDRARHERDVAEARATLGDDDVFDSAWSVGCGMTMEEAIEFALATAMD